MPADSKAISLTSLASRAAVLKATQDKANRKTGRIIMALDATASRQGMWATSKKIMHSIFNAIASIGELEIQLGFYRSYDDCQFAAFTSDISIIKANMDTVQCIVGQTQIRSVLAHAIAESAQGKIDAVVIIGDTIEEHGSELTTIRHYATSLGALNIPIFMLLESDKDNYDFERVKGEFTDIARRSGGAYADFDESAASRLADLLGSIATFAVGGRAALEKSGSEGAKLLLSQLK